MADLVTIEAFQALLRYLFDRQGSKPTEALHGLAGGLLPVARYHVGVDKETEVRLATIVKNLDVGASGFRSKTRTRLKAFEDDRPVAVLLHLPTRLLAEAKAAKSIPAPQATGRNGGRDRDLDLCSASNSATSHRSAWG